MDDKESAYDTNNVYNLFGKKFSNVDIVIPPRSNSIDEKHNHWMRNRNLREIKCYSRMKWQTDRDYGKRNQAERAIGRYKEFLVIDYIHVNLNANAKKPSLVAAY